MNNSKKIKLVLKIPKSLLNWFQKLKM